MSIWETCTTTLGNGDIQTRMQLRTMSGRMVQLQLVSVFHQRLHRRRWSGYNLWSCWCLGGMPNTRASLTWVACACTQSQDVIRSQVAAEGHDWFCGPAAVKVCLDVCSPSCFMGPWESCVISMHAESALSFTGQGLSSPVHQWMLQQENWPWPLYGKAAASTQCTPDRWLHPSTWVGESWSW